MRRSWRRRDFLRLAGLGTAGLAASCMPGLSGRVPGAPTASAELAELAASIQPTGVPRDGIPPIDRPRFVSARAMEYLLKEEDAVFLLYHRGEIRVYPQLVLVWHEVVNDEVGGVPLSVTYCPLTGSVVAFRGRSPDDEPLTFGTTGKLLNANLVMYDRQTQSRWPQILGRAVDGPLAGMRLEEIPLVWTTWALWRERGLEAPVLSAQTGHARAYGRDPYGSYSKPSQGYYDSEDLLYPVLHHSDRLHPKRVVVGLKSGTERLALSKRQALARGVWNLSAGSQPLVAVREPELETVWVFERRLEGQTLELVGEGPGRLVDGQGRSWRREGPALVGEAGRLPAAVFYEVMWFAWFAFYPRTELLA